MATLRQYYDTDFNNTVRMHVRASACGEDLDAVVLFDFVGYFAYVSCFVSGQGRTLDFFTGLLRELKYGKTQLRFDSKVTLPSAKRFHGALTVENTSDFEISARFWGSPDSESRKDLQASRRLFIYSESDLTDDDIIKLKAIGRELGHVVQFRSGKYVAGRTQFEVPLAFISHDSRDTDAVARKIAINLERMLCPVWYDEFSLKVGDRLRESIEKGLKECHKCILILSPNFLSNNGWTKKEFDSIFTREILEERNLILPVWHQVTKDLVYDYSPSLLNVKGLDWNKLGEEEVCRRLHRAIVD